jgi:general secretion pathway protein D
MSFHRSFALLFLGLAAAYGQEPDEVAPDPVTPPQPAEARPRPIRPPGVPIPGLNPPPAAGAPEAEQPVVQAGLPLGQNKITTDINEPKLTGTALAGLYRKYTGRRVIVSAGASTAEFSFVQEATEQDPLTFAEAAELLKKAAIIENFVFVPDGLDPNLDYLTVATAGIRPTNIGIRVYNENSPLPEGDAVISYVMTLSNIKPAEAVNTFTQIIGTFGPYGSIAAVPNASAVIITENTSLIRKLIDLKAEIDKPSSQVASRFIKVQYADVTEIATTLTELLTAQQSAQTTAGIQRVDAAAPATAPPAGGITPAVAGQPGSGSSGEATPVQIVPDPRTNRIFAMGRPVDLVFVESLVREFDVETSEKNFLRRKLRFLTVSDFLPIAGDALNRAFTGTGGDSGGAQGGGAAGGNAGGSGGRPQTSNRQASTSAGSRSSSRSGSTGANYGGMSGSDGSNSTGGGTGSGLSDPEVNAAPESVLVGRTLLVADNITNSIVVQGPPSGLEIIERLLDQIDVKPDQVMISTVIGQLTLDDNFSLGVDYLNKGADHAIRGGSGAGPKLPIIGKFKPGNLLGVPGLQVYGNIGDNLDVYLTALQKKSDFTVLSRPSIFTSNNQKGTISSGERIAIPTGSTSYGSSDNASTQIEYQDVVLKLEVIPLVNSDNEITMQIALLNDEQNGTQTIEGGAGGGGDLTVPKISTREILTNVTVPNNETVVLGGLIVGRDGQDKTGIPILSSIPYIGGFFGRNTNTKNRSELMVFIQPSIVKNDRSLNAVQADMDARYKASPKTREMADGPALLPPLDTIQPVSDKAASYQATEPAALPVIKKKTSIGPAHRR